MSISEVIHKNHKVVGQILAEMLVGLRQEKPTILGISSGGTVIAREIASVLKAPLDVMTVRKIKIATYPKYTIGVLAPGNVQIFNETAISLLGIKKDEIDAAIAKEKKAAADKSELYGKDKPLLPFAGKTVVIADNGVVTAKTALAAIRSVRKMRPQKVVFASGVCSCDAFRPLKEEADEVVVLSVCEGLRAISPWYRGLNLKLNVTGLAKLK